MWRHLRSRGADRRAVQRPMSDLFPSLRHTLSRSLDPNGPDRAPLPLMVWTFVAESRLILYKPPVSSLDERKSRQARRSSTTSPRPPTHSGWLVSFVVPIRRILFIT